MVRPRPSHNLDRYLSFALNSAIGAFAPHRTGKHRQMSIEDEIRQKILVALEPTRLEVINESELHAGHRSSPGTGESHFRLLVVSAAFAGKSRLQRHRLVNDILSHELDGKVHALALKTYAPGEEIR